MTTLAAAVAFPTALLATWLARVVALRLGIVVAPRADRWHEQPTPLLGGVGIAVGFAAAVTAALATGAIDATHDVLGIAGGCLVLFLAGLVDDVRSLNPLAKLAAQFGAAALVVAAGLRVEVVHNDVGSIAVALLWLVGMTNAFNLLDNIDGLAATLASIAALYFAVDAVTLHPNNGVLALALGLAFACAGFLPFNLRFRRKAAIFMGDSGSQVLGFALAAISLASSWKIAGAGVTALFLPVLVLAVPILDTTLVTVMRLVERRPVYRGGRDHASHRLVYLGLSETRAVLFLGAVAAAVGGTSLAYQVLDNTAVTTVGVLLTFALLVQLATYLSDVQRDPSSRGSLFAVRGRRLLEVVVDFALMTASFAAAYFLRTDGAGTAYQRHIFFYALPAVLAARYAAFVLLGLYRGVWRYAGAREATAAVAAVGASALAAFLFVGATQEWGDFHRSVFVIDALICIPLIIGSRLAERAIFRGFTLIGDRELRRRTLIVGAGRGGRSLLRELRESPGEQVVGFVDDDPQLHRRRLQGVPVLGSLDEIGRSLGMSRPDVVLVTIPAAPRERLDLVVEACSRAEVPCRFVRREVDLDPRVVLGAGAAAE